MLFLLRLSLSIPSGVISLVACCAPTDLGSSFFSVIYFFLFIWFKGFSRKDCWNGLHSLIHWTTFCQNSPPWPVHLGWPYMARLIVSLTYTRLWSMWLDWLVFCDYGFSVSALWCPLATPTILLGFLLPWRWGISSRLLQQSTATASYLGRGRPSWLWTWSSSYDHVCS